MDPIGDVHLNFPTCQEQGIDMTKVSFEVVGDQIQAQIDVTKPIFEQWGYREYYIWIDVDPSQRKGYQPYFPHSVAWENFHADYRMFFSLNQPLNQKQPVFVRGVQDCSESNCENEVGLHNPQQQFQVEVKGSRVLFRAPLALFPNWGKEPSFQLAATTYFQLHTCNGEDDAPQWGELTKRIRIQDVTNPKP